MLDNLLHSVACMELLKNKSLHEHDYQHSLYMLVFSFWGLCKFAPNTEFLKIVDDLYVFVDILYFKIKTDKA